MTETTGAGTGAAPEKKTRKRRPGEYRYQWKTGDTWQDSPATFKGPAEALAAAQENNEPDTIIRAIRVASGMFKVKAVTTTGLEKIKQ